MEDLYNELSLRSHEPYHSRDSGNGYAAGRRIVDSTTTGSDLMSSSSGMTTKRNPIVLPGDEAFDVNVNVLNGYGIHDIYHVDFDSESLGDGGFGTVFSGSHQFEPDTPVAVKKISFGVMRMKKSKSKRRKSRRPTLTSHNDAAQQALPGSGGSSSSHRGEIAIEGAMGAAADNVDAEQVHEDYGDVDDDDDDYFGSAANGGAPDLRRLIESIEIAILKMFRNDYRVVHLHEYFVSTEPDTRITSLFLVTEFLPGGELFDCIKERITKHLQLDPEEQRQRQPFCEGDVRDIFRTLLEAIQFMHQHSVIHRDLKPSNLLLQMKDVPTSLKLADFGQSKVLPVGETTRTSTGTPGYRYAPERDVFTNMRMHCATIQSFLTCSCCCAGRRKCTRGSRTGNRWTCSRRGASCSSCWRGTSPSRATRSTRSRARRSGASTGPTSTAGIGSASPPSAWSRGCWPPPIDD
jgi:Protein kinase domain